MQPISHQKRLGNYPQWSVITTVAITIFMIGLLSLFVLYAGKLTDLLKSSMEVQVYMQKGLSLEDSLQAREKLINSRFVIRKKNIPQYSYVTKEEAAKKMIAESGEDFIAFLGENPLHDAYILQVQEKFYTKEQLKKVKEELEQVNGVFEVAYTEALVDDIQNNVQKIGVVIAIVVVVTLLIVIIIINNALRLALYSQRFLIRSMQLVGATAFFIKKPFLWRATVQGFFGGVGAAILLSLVLIFAHTNIPELNILHDWFQLSLLYVSLLLGGIVICSLSAYTAVTRYLRMSLDELY